MDSLSYIYYSSLLYFIPARWLYEKICGAEQSGLSFLKEYNI